MKIWRAVSLVLLAVLFIAVLAILLFVFFRSVAEYPSVQIIRIFDPVVRRLALSASTILVIGIVFCILVVGAMMWVRRKRTGR